MSAVGRLRHLIVIIPGIGGSILAPEGGRPRWGGSLAHVGTGIVWPQKIAIDSEEPLVPMGLLPTLGAIGPLHAICGYDAALSSLRRQFPGLTLGTYQPGARMRGVSVLLYPYDFRRSIAEAAEGLSRAVSAAFEGTDRADRRNRVVVLAHSMGGLVARYWIGALGGWHECAQLMTFGTPHRGAPKALDWLVNGARIGPVRLGAATRELRRWPSLYELLPQYEAVWDENRGHEVELVELPETLTATSPSLAAYSQTFATMAAAARTVHEDIATAWREIPDESRPVLTTYFTRGHSTTNLLTLADAGRRLRVSTSDPDWRGNVGWLGDGTVPALCAIPPDLNENQEHWRYDNVRHGDYAAMGPASSQLLSLSGEQPPTRGQRESDEILGLGLDDICSNKEPFHLTARVYHPDHADRTGVELVTFAAWDEGRTRCLRRGALVESADGTWRAEAAPLPVGRYIVAVEARRPGLATLSMQTHVLSVDPSAE